MTDHIEIKGGADEQVASVIAAVVASIEEAEREASAIRPRPIRQSQWVRAGRPLERQAPMTSAEYNRIPGSADEDVEPLPPV